MEDLLKADIFFFVATLAVAVIGIIFLVVLVFAWKVLRDIRRISKHVSDVSEVARDEGVHLMADLKEARESGRGVKPKLGLILSSLSEVASAVGFVNSLKKKKKSRK